MRWLLIPLVLSGCATPITEEERQYRLIETYDKWTVCKRVYNVTGNIWYADWEYSEHDKRKGVIPRYLDMRLDLGRNNCFTILKRLGYD